MSTGSISSRAPRTVITEKFQSQTEKRAAVDQRLRELKESIAARRKPKSAAPAQPPPVSTQPVTPPTPVSEPGTARTLAERYVAQYETQSGTTLTSEQRTAKIQEVEKFYETQARDGRLEKIVFA